MSLSLYIKQNAIFISIGQAIKQLMKKISSLWWDKELLVAWISDFFLKIPESIVQCIKQLYLTLE